MNPARPHAYGNIVLDEMSAHPARISPLAGLAALLDEGNAFPSTAPRV